MDSGTVRANGLDLAYDTFGARTDPPVVLVMGLATPRWAWPDELCETIAAAGRFVLRYDNRDAGESTRLTELGNPRELDVFLRRRAPYTIDDMADDLAGVVDALDLGPVHLVGASMGGFIAQTAAIRRPEHLHSLTLIMTSTGNRRVGRPAWRVVREFLRRAPVTERDGAIQQRVDTFRLIGSPGYDFDEDWVREVSGLAYDRGGHDPVAYRRHLAAVLTQPDRTRQLSALRLPTLVIHGLDDPLVHPSGGLAIARAIRQSKFIGYSGMGHDLPRALWPHFAQEIVRHTDAPARTDRVLGVAR
jgi:pimeloyl-ACP methyl ester carboxylesterase